MNSKRYAEIHTGSKGILCFASTHRHWLDAPRKFTCTSYTKVDAFYLRIIGFLGMIILA
jgi:hypothetical protein